MLAHMQIQGEEHQEVEEDARMNQFKNMVQQIKEKFLLEPSAKGRKP